MDGIALLGSDGLVVGVWKGEQPWTLSLVSSQEKRRQSPVSSLWSVGVGWGGDEVGARAQASESGLGLTAPT